MSDEIIKYRYFTSDHPVWSFQRLLHLSPNAKYTYHEGKWYFDAEGLDKGSEWPCLLTGIPIEQHNESGPPDNAYCLLRESGAFAVEPAADLARHKYRWRGERFAMIVPIKDQALVEKLVTWLATYFEMVEVATQTNEYEVWLIRGGQVLWSELENWNSRIEVYESLSNFRDLDGAWMDKDAYVRWGQIIGRPRRGYGMNEVVLLSNEEKDKIRELRIACTSFNKLGVARTLKIEQVKIETLVAENAKPQKADIPVHLHTISELRSRINWSNQSKQLDREIRRYNEQLERVKLKRARLKHLDESLTTHQVTRTVVGLHIRTHDANWPSALLPFLQSVKEIEDLVFGVFSVRGGLDVQLDIFIFQKQLKDIRYRLDPNHNANRLVLIGAGPTESICLDESMDRESMGCVAGFDIGAGLYPPVIKKLSEELKKKLSEDLKKGRDILPYLRASANAIELLALDIKAFKPVDELLNQIAFRNIPDDVKRDAQCLLSRTFAQVPVLNAAEQRLQDQLKSLEGQLSEAKKLVGVLGDYNTRMKKAKKDIDDLEARKAILTRDVAALEARMRNTGLRP